MLTGVHFLLSYQCTFECDHCFLYCSPNVSGTFTITQLRRMFDQIAQMPSVNEVYFEGGEPFLFHPLMLEGARLAHEQGLGIGIVTNCYWATSVDDAVLWLKPLKGLNITDISISDDAFHSGDEGSIYPKNAEQAAKLLGLPVGAICIEPPKVSEDRSPERKGEPVVGGDVCFRGRAADKLTEGLPVRPWQSYQECSREELVQPKRVHVDPFGNVHVCQGVSIGNIWQTPLKELMESYDAHSHPICGPLLKGGPAELARTYDISPAVGYVDECHLCFDVRRQLLDRLPDELAPRQVYGVND